MDRKPDKLKVVKAFLAFLVQERSNPELGPDQVEALHVAMECLEVVYNLERHQYDPVPPNMFETTHTDSGTVGETQGVNEMGAVGEEGAVREAEAAGKTEATGKQEEAKGADTVKDADMNLEQTEENKLKAEALKTEGNEAIRAEQFLVAIEKYSAAIALDPRNAVYFCNRAAAYTRLNRNAEAVADCKKAVEIDRNYSKAYGRLGIAYSNMQNYQQAINAYRRASELDPSNEGYRSNLRLAEQQFTSTTASGASGAGPSNAGGPQEAAAIAAAAAMSSMGARVDIAQLMRTPDFMNAAMHMIGDPMFRDVFLGLIGNDDETPLPANAQMLFEAGQTIATRLRAQHPSVLDNLTRVLVGEDDEEEEEQQEGKTNVPGDKRKRDPE